MLFDIPREMISEIVFGAKMPSGQGQIAGVVDTDAMDLAELKGCGAKICAGQRAQGQPPDLGEEILGFLGAEQRAADLAAENGTDLQLAQIRNQ
jgi:hypothetical protein